MTLRLENRVVLPNFDTPVARVNFSCFEHAKEACDDACVCVCFSSSTFDNEGVALVHENYDALGGKAALLAKSG
jgi:hypothetical protein